MIYTGPHTLAVLFNKITQNCKLQGIPAKERQLEGGKAERKMETRKERRDGDEMRVGGNCMPSFVKHQG